MKPHFLLALPLGAVVTIAAFTARPDEGVRRTEDIIYGRKFGTALTMALPVPITPAEKSTPRPVEGGAAAAACDAAI